LTLFSFAIAPDSYFFRLREGRQKAIRCELILRPEIARIIVSDEEETITGIVLVLAEQREKR
jgi:hypothetical protein